MVGRSACLSTQRSDIAAVLKAMKVVVHFPAGTLSAARDQARDRHANQNSLGGATHDGHASVRAISRKPELGLPTQFRDQPNAHRGCMGFDHPWASSSATGYCQSTVDAPVWDRGGDALPTFPVLWY